MPADLPALIHRVRTHPGVVAKSEIGLVSDVFGDSDWVAGPGDDGAVVPVAGTSLVVGGEAILPSFVAADPHGAGVAAVTTNLNDLAAMGAWPLALVDTVTGPRPVIQQVLEGMRWASRLYQVPVVGGHLTVTAGPPGLSAFGLGRSDRPLAARDAEPGQSLVVGCCVEGRMRADFRRSTSAVSNWPAMSGCWPRARPAAGSLRPRTSAWPAWSVPWPCCWSATGWA
jgi:selenophosphate synthetase-related protein